jgi:hypothetical protein
MADKFRQRSERAGEGGGMTLNLPKDVKLLKAKKGKLLLDIVPYIVASKKHPEVKAGEMWPERTYFVHGNVGPEGKLVVCPKSVAKPCPICEEYEKLRRDPDAEEELVKSLRAKKRQLFNVRVKGEKEFQIFDMSYFCFGELLEEEVREGEESNAFFADLKGGKTLRIRFDEEKFGTRTFVKAARIDFLDRSELPEAILKKTQELDSLLKIMSYEELEALFHGSDDEKDDSDDDDDDEPKKGKGKKKPAADEDDDDADSDEDSDEDDADESDDDGDGDSDEDDEDEKPAKGKSKGKKGKKSKSDDDDEDDGAEDDDEDGADDEDGDADEAGDDDEDSDDGDEDSDADDSDDDEDEECPACKGSKKNKAGKKCPACGGTGVKAKPEEDEDDADEGDSDDDDSDGDSDDDDGDDEDSDSDSEDDEDSDGDDGDDDDDDGDEDDEDEKPAKGKKAKGGKEVKKGKFSRK